MSLIAASSRALRAALFIALGVAACKKADDATGSGAKVPAALVVVQGDNQTAQAGKDLPTPIVLRVVDSNGIGMPHQTVTLTVQSGGGAVTPSSDSTNANGEVKLKWTLGANYTDQSFLAKVPGLDAVTVRAMGLVPVQIVLVQGGGQTAKPGAALTNSILVRVVGEGNVPMQGVTVGFQILTGGGGMSPPTVITNALGEALTKWTLGSAGVNTALAVVGSLPPLQISATAQ